MGIYLRQGLHQVRPPPSHPPIPGSLLPWKSLFTKSTTRHSYACQRRPLATLPPMSDPLPLPPPPHTHPPPLVVVITPPPPLTITMAVYHHECASITPYAPFFPLPWWYQPDRAAQPGTLIVASAMHGLFPPPGSSRAQREAVRSRLLPAPTIRQQPTQTRCPGVSTQVDCLPWLPPSHLHEHCIH